MCLNDWAAPGISPTTTPIVVVIASTTGDGDSPDNAGKGLLALKRRSDSLSGMKFSVMGLGDSNYTNFMKIPRTVERLLRKHGAEEFYPCKEADEVDGLEDIVDAWRDDLWAALDSAMATEVHPLDTGCTLLHTCLMHDIALTVRKSSKPTSHHMYKADSRSTHSQVSLRLVWYPHGSSVFCVGHPASRDNHTHAGAQGNRRGAYSGSEGM